MPEKPPRSRARCALVLAVGRNSGVGAGTRNGKGGPRHLRLMCGERVAMPNRETYQKKALACLEAAEKMNDLQERAATLAIACDFMKLADQVGQQRDPRAVHRR